MLRSAKAAWLAGALVLTGMAAAPAMAEPDPELVAAGESVFKKCKACHKIDGSNATGPHLDGVVDRAVGAVDGFSYSGALEQVGDVWSKENLFHFLENPKAVAPGTAMGFAGLIFLTGGGLLAELHWRAPFGLYGIALLVLLCAVAFLPETRGAEAQRQ